MQLREESSVCAAARGIQTRKGPAEGETARRGGAVPGGARLTLVGAQISYFQQECFGFAVHDLEPVRA